MEHLQNSSIGSRIRAANSRGRKARPSGAAAVELAIVLPLLLMLALAAADGGRFVHQWIAVINSSRVGANYAATHSFTVATSANWEAGIRTAVHEELQHLPEFDATRLTVTITSATDADGRQRVEVRAAYPFDTLVNWPTLPSAYPLRATTVFPMIR
jgi:Flp pilus assembly protein TadG